MSINPIDKAILDKEIKKILVIQLGGIGDLVLSIPALKALRNRFEGAYIALLVISRSAGLIEGCPYIDNLFIFDIYNTNLISLFKNGVFIRTWKVIKVLRRQKFDAILNLENIGSYNGAIKMAILFWLIGCKYKVGRDTDGRGFFLNVKVKDDSQDSKHEAEVHLDVARVLEAQISEIKLELPVFEEDNAFVSNFLTQQGVSSNDLLIGFNPLSFRAYQRWPKERWISLGQQMIKKYRGKIIIIGQRSGQETINEIANAIDKKRVMIAAELTLKQLAVLMKRFNLFITNDGGPMHIAAATQTPLIALFGPGDIHKFSPYCSSNKCVIVRKKVNCRRPCHKIKCNDRKCMELITVEDVIKAVEGILV